MWTAMGERTKYDVRKQTNAALCSLCHIARPFVRFGPNESNAIKDKPKLNKIIKFKNMNEWVHGVCCAYYASPRRELDESTCVANVQPEDRFRAFYAEFYFNVFFTNVYLLPANALMFALHFRLSLCASVCAYECALSWSVNTQTHEPPSALFHSLFMVFISHFFAVVSMWCIFIHSFRVGPSRVELSQYI